MKKISFLIQFVIFLILFSAAAVAETFRFFGPLVANVNLYVNTQAGNANYFDITYNTETKVLRYIVNFSPVAGVLPDAFDLVINNGPNPKGTPGQLAAFYFNARNINSPQLSVYAYHGTASTNSWQTGAPGQGPDKILSTVAPAGGVTNPSGWVKQLIATNESNGSRTLGFIIDATKINSHSPKFPSPNPMIAWEGAQIGQNFGLWFHPNQSSNITYGNDGFLTAYHSLKLGSYDSFGPIPTVKEDPICSYTFVSPKVEIGKPFQFTITGTDQQNNSLKLDYSGLPANAVINPAAGAFGASPRVVNFSWTPQTANAGQTYNIGVLFTDPHGATVSCPLTFNVPANKPPVCSASPTSAGYQNLSCGSSVTSVKLDGSSSVDPEFGTTGLTYTWTSNCPGAAFDNPNSVSPVLTFKSENSNGTPVSCTATLQVFDGKDLTQCGAAVSVKSCTRDCAGTINGSAKFDQCGKCNGNGQSCLDCKGTPFGAAVKDVCGVCAGNGTSCACTESSIRDLLFQLDINAKQQANLAVRAAKRLSVVARGEAGISEFVVAIRKEATTLYMENWSQSWSIQQVVQNCPANSPLACVSVSNQSTLNTYNTNADALYKLTLEVLREVKKRKKSAEFKNLNSYRNTAKALYDTALKGASVVPSSYQSCK